jgi:hypothetical protein
MSALSDKQLEQWDIELNGRTSQLIIGFKSNPNQWVHTQEEKTISIETHYTDHFNHWQFIVNDTLHDLEAQFEGIWSQWQLKGGNLKKFIIAASYSNSWDNWTLKTTAGDITINTRIHNHYEDWELSGSIDKLHPAEEMAVIFMPVFVARIHQKGLAQ